MIFLFIIIFLYDVFVSRYRNYLNKIYLRKHYCYSDFNKFE